MLQRFGSPLLLVVLAVTSLPADDAPSSTARGDRIRDAYFRRQVHEIEEADLAEVRDRAGWEKERPRLHRQLLDMLGLWPLPPRTDLHAVVTGKVERERFTVEKLHFQSLPGLYVTASLYLPKGVKGPVPAVLYVCGHSNVVIDKVPYGSKVFYQHHGIWYAEHGYACLIPDTLELGEIPGEHHGTYRKDRWWWQTLGYTPAGVECWNGMRAIDYLQSRKEIDGKRIGVAGRSGGGATSWWVGAADERVQCLNPVAGLGDLRAHVLEGVAPRFHDGVISGHCDCMYFVNTYRWDLGRLIALCAPRPLLLGNSDADDIFPVEGYRRPASRARRVYDLYGAGDRFALLETKGPHKDTPELRQGEYRWMNRWLKGEKGPVTEDEPRRLTPQELKVFGKLPADAINGRIDETFRKPARPELPGDAEAIRKWWPAQKEKWLAGLEEQVFGGWPRKAPDLAVKPAEDVTHEGLRLRAYDFVSEEEVPLRLWLLTAAEVDRPTLTVLTAVDEAGWRDWLAELGPDFQKALQVSDVPERDEEKFKQNRRMLARQKWAFATVAPRGIGPTRWSEASPFDGKPAGRHILRRFALLGQTLDGQRVWDVRRAVACLRSLAPLREAPLWLQGTGDMAGIVLYAALFEPAVARLDLWHPPASHRSGPIFLNVRRLFDMPQAVALALPHQVRIYVKDDEEARPWGWAGRLQEALGQKSLQVRRVGRPTPRP
jgi:cephalosporin-C deacetylase-like acetyl esterase